MAACCAYGCTNRFSKKIQGVTFHRFPENPEQRDAWISAVQRKNWRPSRSTRICSEHFSEDQIDRTSYFRVRLRENAVPNIFKARRPFGNKKGERDRDPENERNSSEYCKIAVRPSKTAPLVISVKPAKTTSTPVSLVTTTPVQSTLVTSSAPTLTTALPISLFPQILSASGTPIITSAMPSIIATNVGNFLAGLPQTVTLPITSGLATSLATPINSSQPVVCNDKAVISNGSSILFSNAQNISPEEDKRVDQLQRKNVEYFKKIKTLQQKVRRQRRMIDRLTCTIRAMKGGKGFDGDDFIAACLMSENSEVELAEFDDPADEELAEMNLKIEMLSNSAENDELNFDEGDLNFKEDDLNMRHTLILKEGYAEALERTEGESCTELSEATIKTEFRTTSPDEILP